MAAILDSNSAQGETNGESYIGSTSITKNHVQDAFREYFTDDQLSLVRVTTERIAAGQGFSSFILRLELTWNEQQVGKRLPKSVVLKSLSKDAIEKLMKMWDTSVNEQKQFVSSLMNQTQKSECAVYELFGKLNSNSPVPVAKLYCAWLADDRRPPMIIMEDLSDRARVLGDMLGSLTYEQMLSLADALANLHAWCLTTEVDWKRNMDTFEDRMRLMESFFSMVQNGFQKAKESLPDIFALVDEAKALELFKPESMTKIHELHKGFIPDVLVHGDFWANNLMFNKLSDGSMGDHVVAFIDWQMAYVGNPMFDFGRVLSMSFDADLRDAHLESIIKRYYDTLKKNLGPDRTPKEFTFDRALQMAQQMVAFNSLMFLFMHTIGKEMFASGDGPDAEEKLQILIARTKRAVEYAVIHLDIAAPSK